jgi:hypothetical protein
MGSALNIRHLISEANYYRKLGSIIGTGISNETIQEPIIQNDLQLLSFGRGIQ